MTARLCYISGNIAYFTTREPFTDQWGDDWNDAPYQCNAGNPYCYHVRDDVPPWSVSFVYFAGPFDTPGYEPHRSVQEINRGACPWLIPRDWSEAKPVLAGATVEEFREVVAAAGGCVSVEHDYV